MSVYLYTGGFRMVKRSGVGQAILHQHQALAAANIPVSQKLASDTRIVHINTVFPDSLLAALRAKRRGAKVVYYAHSTMEDFRNSFRCSNTLAPLFRRWLMLCYRRGDVILTPTEYSKKILEGYGLEKPIYSISNGIDLEKFRFSPERRAAFRSSYRLKPETPVVISVGHMIERKGILDYITLAERMPGVRFFWFGYTEPWLLPGKVRRAIRSAPQNLTFAGYVTQEQLLDAYCGADVFAFLSKEETEGIVVLEALSTGIPTVVRDIPVYNGWLKDKESVYKASNLPDFERTVSGLLDGTLPRLTNGGKAVAEARSFSHIGRQLASIYAAEGFLSAEEDAEPFRNTAKAEHIAQKSVSFSMMRGFHRTEADHNAG